MNLAMHCTSDTLQFLNYIHYIYIYIDISLYIISMQQVSAKQCSKKLLCNLWMCQTRVIQKSVLTTAQQNPLSTNHLMPASALAVVALHWGPPWLPFSVVQWLVSVPDAIEQLWQSTLVVWLSRPDRLKTSVEPNADNLAVHQQDCKHRDVWRSSKTNI